MVDRRREAGYAVADEMRGASAGNWFGWRPLLDAGRRRLAERRSGCFQFDCCILLIAWFFQCNVRAGGWQSFRLPLKIASRTHVLISGHL